MWMIRWACLATLASCVTRMIVRRVALIEFLEQGENLLARVRIEVARRLVGEQNGRVVDQRPGDGHTLLLAAGKLGGLMVQPIGQTQPTEHLARTLACFPFGDVGRVRQRHGHVVQGAGAGQQVEVLEHETESCGSRTIARWSAESVDTSSPSSQYWPDVGRSRQPRMFMSVLLPEPEAPIRATSSPRATFSEIPLSTGTEISPM